MGALNGDPHTLNRATEIGLLAFDESRHQFRFAHDGIQEVIYGWVAESERPRFHHKIGRQLWRKFSLDQVERHIFVLLSQLLWGKSEMLDRRERTAIATLCLSAAKKAAEMSSFQTAHYYLEEGLTLLDSQSWKTDYELSVQLYSSAAEAACCVAKVERVLKLVREVELHAQCVPEVARVQALKVYALGNSGAVELALSTAMEALAGLGETFRTGFRSLELFLGARRLRKRLRHRSNESILRLAPMTDTRKLAVMNLLHHASIYAYFVDRSLSPIIAFRMIETTLDAGIAASSCLGFMMYSMMLCG